MSNKINKKLNLELRNTVRNYNKRVVRAEKRGFRNLPDKVKVSELKTRYQTEEQLVREIRRLQKLKQEDILTVKENQGGAKAVGWKFDYIKSNLNDAKNYFEQEYKRVSKRTAKFPGERLYLDTIKSKIKLLEQNINSMSQSEFRSAESAVTEFYNAPRMREQQYRGFLSEVEWVMEKTGIPEEQRDEFFKKFSKLTPSQFLYAYDNNSIIDRVYNLYVRQGENDPFLSDPKDAKKVINELMKEADVIVKDAQLNVD